MFQPQPTPYSSFSSYGVASALPDFPSFQPAAGLVVNGGSSGGPPVFRDPIFSPVASSVAADRNLNIHAHSNSMGGYKMAASEIEEQEALARDFQPALEVCGAWKSEIRSTLTAVQGPLVGEKKNSHAITEEYAKADPIYVAKTAVSTSADLNEISANWHVGKALPQKYSHYRPILGDGNCGWRGKCCPMSLGTQAFVEALFNSADPYLFSAADFFQLPALVTSRHSYDCETRLNWRKRWDE
jgi:hypothetical protein